MSNNVRKARIWYNVDSDNVERTQVVNVQKVERMGNTLEVWLEGSESPDFYVNGIHFLE